MSDISVRIVRLEPMRVASAYGFGTQPEGEAWQKLFEFASSKGLRLKDHRFFGFNNPSPSPASPNYGYEQWITIDSSLEPAGDIEIKEFPGGLYADTQCRLSYIGDAWKKPVIWREDSKYKQAHHQWLEEILNPEIFLAGIDEARYENAIFALYLPITE